MQHLKKEENSIINTFLTKKQKKEIRKKHEKKVINPAGNYLFINSMNAVDIMGKIFLKFKKQFL